MDARGVATSFYGAGAAPFRMTGSADQVISPRAAKETQPGRGPRAEPVGEPRARDELGGERVDRPAS